MPLQSDFDSLERHKFYHLFRFTERHGASLTLCGQTTQEITHAASLDYKNADYDRIQQGRPESSCWYDIGGLIMQGSRILFPKYDTQNKLRIFIVNLGFIQNLRSIISDAHHVINHSSVCSIRLQTGLFDLPALVKL